MRHDFVVADPRARRPRHLAGSYRQRGTL